MEEDDDLEQIYEQCGNSPLINVVFEEIDEVENNRKKKRKKVTKKDNPVEYSYPNEYKLFFLYCIGINESAQLLFCQDYSLIPETHGDITYTVNGEQIVVLENRVRRGSFKQDICLLSSKFDLLELSCPFFLWGIIVKEIENPDKPNEPSDSESSDYSINNNEIRRYAFIDIHSIDLVLPALKSSSYLTYAQVIGILRKTNYYFLRNNKKTKEQIDVLMKPYLQQLIKVNGKSSRLDISRTPNDITMQMVLKNINIRHIICNEGKQLFAQGYSKIIHVIPVTLLCKLAKQEITKESIFLQYMGKVRFNEDFIDEIVNEEPKSPLFYVYKEIHNLYFDAKENQTYCFKVNAKLFNSVKQVLPHEPLTTYTIDNNNNYVFFGAKRHLTHDIMQFIKELHITITLIHNDETSILQRIFDKVYNYTYDSYKVLVFNPTRSKIFSDVGFTSVSVINGLDEITLFKGDKKMFIIDRADRFKLEELNYIIKQLTTKNGSTDKEIYIDLFGSNYNTNGSFNLLMTGAFNVKMNDKVDIYYLSTSSHIKKRSYSLSGIMQSIITIKNLKKIIYFTWFPSNNIQKWIIDKYPDFTAQIQIVSLNSKYSFKDIDLAIIDASYLTKFPEKIIETKYKILQLVRDNSCPDIYLINNKLMEPI